MSLYAQRDTEALGEYYLRHVTAMTAEKLHSKAAIAAELAARDMEIEYLRGQVHELIEEIELLRDDDIELED